MKKIIFFGLCSLTILVVPFGYAMMITAFPEDETSVMIPQSSDSYLNNKVINYLDTAQTEIHPDIIKLQNQLLEFMNLSGPQGIYR